MSINLPKDLSREFKNSAVVDSVSEASHNLASATSRKQVRALYTIKFLISVSSRLYFMYLYPIFNEAMDADNKKLGSCLNSIKLSLIITQAFSSIGLGLVSDKFGRKIALNTALLGSSLSMGLFGFNKSSVNLSLLYTLNCAFNCSSDIIKTMIVELSDRDLRPSVLVYLDYVEFIGKSVGSMLGAYFTIAFFGNYGFKGNENPGSAVTTLIPYLISASANIIAYILSRYYLKETLYENRDSLNIGDIKSESHENLDKLSKLEQNTLFGLRISKKSKLILISSSLLAISYNGFLLTAYDWPASEISKVSFKLIVENIYFIPLLFITMIVALLKYPYICKQFGALKVYKYFFTLTPVLFATSSILAHFAKIRYNRTVIIPLTFLTFAQKGLGYLYNTSSNLLLAESFEATKNLGTLYGASGALGHIAGLAAMSIVSTIQTISSYDILPFQFNYSTLSWGLLTTLSLTGYWISTKIKNL